VVRAALCIPLTARPHRHDGTSADDGAEHSEDRRGPPQGLTHSRGHQSRTKTLGTYRARATRGQYEQLLEWADAFVDRRWAIEFAGGLGYLLAQAARRR